MSNIVRFDVLRTVSYTSITGSYTPFGLPFSNAMRIVHVKNDTNALIYLSFDGIVDHIALVPGEFELYDFTSDQDSSEHFRFDNRTQVYLKYVGSAPTLDANLTNTAYMSCVYGKGE